MAAERPRHRRICVQEVALSRYTDRFRLRGAVGSAVQGEVAAATEPPDAPWIVVVQVVRLGLELAAAPTGLAREMPAPD